MPYHIITRDKRNVPSYLTSNGTWTKNEQDADVSTQYPTAQKKLNETNTPGARILKFTAIKHEINGRVEVQKGTHHYSFETYK